MITITMTEDEAKKVLHCLQTTNARDNHGELDNILDASDKVGQNIQEQLQNGNISEQEFNSFFKDFKNGEKIEENSGIPFIFFNEDRSSAEIQFCGWSITLKNDGTYFFNDTTGG